MYRRAGLNSIVLLVLMTLVACSAPAAPAPTALPAVTPTAASAARETAGGPISVTDGSGAVVTLNQPATRVACLTSNCIDILADLGVEPYAVLTADTDAIGGLPEFFGARMSAFLPIGGSWMEPAIEEVIAAQPDLIIGHPFAHAELRDQLAGTAPLYLVHSIRSIDDTVRNLKDVAQLLGKNEAAAAAVSKFEAKLADYRARSPRTLIALVIEGSDANISAKTRESTVGQLLAEVTLYPWTAPEGTTSESGDIPYSLERVLSNNPDVLFVITVSWTGPVDPLSQQFAANPVWAQLKAVQQGRVYEVESQIWHNVSGLRTMSLLLDQALGTLYPETFPELPRLQASKS
ncbi:MAG: ABC transporter substrate-binding protein [Roseiflexaceae bacterium]|nr:ABC transporter substrate-binding protein [Roseiflexaceae bacterium]